MIDPVGPDEVSGPHGTAVRVPRSHYTASLATIDAWIITSPGWHPLWSQYMLAVITLADVPGMPPAVLERPGSTHQMHVMALSPEHGPYTPGSVAEGTVHFLTPTNIGEQFEASDEQALELSVLCARAVVDGVLNPETADAPERIRATWAQSIRRTLDHARDPHHGAAN
jgi:hypothetical protein